MGKINLEPFEGWYGMPLIFYGETSLNFGFEFSWRLREFGLGLVFKILTTYKLLHDDKVKIQQTMVD